MISDSARSLLASARGLFEQGLWIQGEWSGYVEDDDEDPDGSLCCYCAVGGVRAGSGFPADYVPSAVSREREAYDEAIVALAATIDPNKTRELLDNGRAFEDVEGIVIEWNDDVGRTIGEVLDVFAGAVSGVQIGGVDSAPLVFAAPSNQYVSTGKGVDE